MRIRNSHQLRASRPAALQSHSARQSDFDFWRMRGHTGSSRIGTDKRASSDRPIDVEKPTCGYLSERLNCRCWLGVSKRKTSGESDLGAALQCGSRIETAREPTTQSLLLSIPVMVPMSCLHFISCSFDGVGD